jgi:hypothetical protein
VSSAKPELAIFNTETNSLVDYVDANETPEQAIIRLAEYGTALTALPIEEAARRHDDAYRTEPIEITEVCGCTRWKSCRRSTGTGPAMARASDTI